MSAALQQSALRTAFDRPAPELVERDLAPCALEPRQDARDVAEILVAHKRISAAQAERIRDVSAKTGKPFLWAAGRLKISSRSDIESALAIRSGAAQDDPAAFSLSKDIVVLRRPEAPQAEQFRLLRTRLATMGDAARLKELSIAPAGPNVRAEYVAANLAVAFAQLRRRTLLIDANLRRPSVSRVFASAPSGGLTAFLSRGAQFDDATSPTIVEFLSISSAGETVRDPQPLLAGHRLQEFLERARSRFDVVVTLTAPHGAVADGQFVWAHAKSAIVVARRDITRSAEIKELALVFRQIGAEAIGSVMTR